MNVKKEVKIVLELDEDELDVLIKLALYDGSGVERSILRQDNEFIYELESLQE